MIGILWICVVAVLAPLYLVVAIASNDAESVVRNGVSIWIGTELWSNISVAWQTNNLGQQLINSTIIAILVTVGKMVLASMSAFAVVYFDTRISRILFWVIFLTMMLPLEVRIVPTYELAANVLRPLQDFLEFVGLAGLVKTYFAYEINLQLSLLDSYAGLSLPLIATATGTFLFRQFFRTLPPTLAESAKLDGAGPVRFFLDIAVPLSKRHFAALATIMFLSAWNQYLWPLIVTTEESMRMVVVGVVHMMPDLEYDAPAWNVTMAGAIVAMLPPLAVVAIFQRFLITGITAAKFTSDSNERDEIE